MGLTAGIAWLPARAPEQKRAPQSAAGQDLAKMTTTTWARIARSQAEAAGPANAPSLSPQRHEAPPGALWGQWLLPTNFRRRKRKTRRRSAWGPGCFLPTQLRLLDASPLVCGGRCGGRHVLGAAGGRRGPRAASLAGHGGELVPDAAQPV